MLRAVLIAVICWAISAHAQQTCNGYAEYCDRPYSQVVKVGTHNSAAFNIASNNIAANQAFNVTTQLRNGVRLLQNQGHLNNGQLNLCHTSCILYNGGTLVDYLGDVKAFLDANPNEVITLLWVNTEGIPMTQWAQAYTDSGLAEYVYVPASTPVTYDAWPTLRQLISSNTRVVSFIAAGADMSVNNYLLDEFAHIWETPYNQLDPSFPCTVDRGAPAEGKMAMLNRYLDVNTTILGIQSPTPDLASIGTTNGVEGIVENARRCASEQNGQLPTFLLFDYYDRVNGSVFQAAANLNSVSYNAIAIGNASISTSSGNTAVESRPLGDSSGAQSMRSAGGTILVSILSLLCFV